MVLLSNIVLAFGQEVHLIDNVEKIESDLNDLREQVKILEKRELEVWGIIAGLITGVATVGLAIILIYQTKGLEKTSRLAYGPKIFPRYIVDDSGLTHIYLYNVGKGNAIDIHLKFFDMSYSPLGVGNIDRYSLASIDIQTFSPLTNTWRPEFVDTGITFDTPNFSYKISGWYRDTNDERIIVEHTYEYPPKIIQ